MSATMISFFIFFILSRVPDSVWRVNKWLETELVFDCDEVAAQMHIFLVRYEQKIFKTALSLFFHLIASWVEKLIRSPYQLQADTARPYSTPVHRVFVKHDDRFRFQTLLFLSTSRLWEVAQLWSSSLSIFQSLCAPQDEDISEEHVFFSLKHLFLKLRLSQ